MIDNSIGGKNLQELFALPIGVEKVKDFPGPSVYTSSTLKRKYIAAMRKSNKAGILGNKIEELVHKELIIPCFLSKGVIRFALSKIFGDPESKNIMGFYASDERKIFLLIDNNVNFFGFSSNHWLASLTIHESMHMCASLQPAKFYSLFNSDLKEFYSELFTRIFKLKTVDKKIISKIIRFIYMMEIKFPQDNATLKKYWTVLMELQQSSSLDKGKFEKVVQDYIVLIKIFWKSLSAFMSVERNYKHITGAIYDAYENVFRVNVDSICVQELTNISEMVSMLSEGKNKLTPKIYRAFKMI